MTLSKRLYWLAGLVAIFAIAAAAATMASANSSAQNASTTAIADEADGQNNEIDDGDGEVDDENGDPANAGQLDDGQDLLPQASITIDEAIAAAQAAFTGDIGEIDLEYHDGSLVFNVDVGDQDVKVDAANGTVLGSGKD